MSTLYIVGTPIGNLGDFSPRGIDTLNEVDFIAAEDTRVSRVLLSHFDINNRLISYHEHNEKEKSQEIVQRILGGESCALISDAGMPAISDPGEILVRACADAGIEIVAVPGPTAAMSALAISGLDTSKFLFEGFLKGKTSEKTDALAQVKNLPYTLIFYESPHRLTQTLEIMLEVLGDRKIALCREITKMYEEVLRLTLSESIEYYKENDPRGEFVLIIEGAKATEEKPSFEQAVAMVTQRQEQGVSLSSAAREVAQITGYKRGKLYKGALEKD